MSNRKRQPATAQPKARPSYVREILGPPEQRGYARAMAKRGAVASHAITPGQIARVSKFLLAKCEEPDGSEDFHVERSGIPQSTFNHAKKGKKLGRQTAARLADYFGWGSDVQGFLNGTEPAGYYSSREEGLSVGYPQRGVVLDRFRGIVATELLAEVQAMVLPDGSPDWTELQWAKEVMDCVSRWERLGKPIEPTRADGADVGGQEPTPRKR